MNKFKTLALSIVALGGLALGGCEKRAPSADQQGKGYVASTDPASTTATPSTTAPSATATPATDDRQNVAGRDLGAAVSDTVSDVYWVDTTGNRAVLHDTATLTQIQQRLAADGFYRGQNDGKTSPELTAAIRQFQAKKGLAETGMIDNQTADAMGLDYAKLSAKPGAATTTDDTLGAKADRAGEKAETKAGELRGEMREGADKLRDKTGTAAEDTKAGAKQLGNEVEAGARDMGRDLESGANKVESGAKDVGRDVESGAKEAGRDIESGAKKLGNEVEKGANEAGRKIDESVK